MQKADFLGEKCKFAWIVKGLELKHIFWNFVQQLNTQHSFHPLTQNTIKDFKSRAQAIFSLLEKTHTYTPWFTKFEFEKIFSLFYIISTQRNYIYQRLDTNSCFAKLRAISNLFSFFYTPCISWLQGPLLKVLARIFILNWETSLFCWKRHANRVVLGCLPAWKPSEVITTQPVIASVLPQRVF
jgi:hypothetical protein